MCVSLQTHPLGYKWSHKYQIILKRSLSDGTKNTPYPPFFITLLNSLSTFVGFFTCSKTSRQKTASKELDLKFKSWASPTINFIFLFVLQCLFAQSTDFFNTSNPTNSLAPLFFKITFENTPSALPTSKTFPLAGSINFPISLNLRICQYLCKGSTFKD